MAGLKPAKVSRTRVLWKYPQSFATRDDVNFLLGGEYEARGDAREFTILDAEGIEFYTRRFGANDTLRELRLVVIKFSAPLPWITPANANFFKYFRFPQVDVSDEHDANADEYLQLHDYRIHLPGSTVSIEDLE
ncbi:hypothetical protein CYMTET_38315 [Cymbomonas tetramitiformis]|uniref:Uncharacterized protein n=1 Tax=Cymbomonas tetramitiformis TaxID=36881 RepID=A0AAE0F5L5_9CHLO|nr:hypothetical protein CYMTET_38315 [Cymbomonas tetramitiformis]